MSLGRITTKSRLPGLLSDGVKTSGVRASLRLEVTSVPHFPFPLFSSCSLLTCFTCAAHRHLQDQGVGPDGRKPSLDHLSSLKAPVGPVLTVSSFTDEETEVQRRYMGCTRSQHL